MYFSMFNADATRQLVRDAGFDIEKTALATQTEGEIDISYTWILARKMRRDHGRSRAAGWGLTDFRILDPSGYYLRITGR